MICRPESEGWLLISQSAHAWVAGVFAHAWGNDLFELPGPRDALVIGTHLHDNGWTDWDTTPPLTEDGLPVNFLGATLEETAPMWRSAVRQVGLINPYSALLVSMHAVTIFERRLERKADSGASTQEIQSLISEQEAVQSGLLQKLSNHHLFGDYLDEHILKATYRVLRICDILSLILCSDVYPAVGTIPDVPVASGAENQVAHYEIVRPYTLVLDPYPFIGSEVLTTVETRQLDKRQFSSQQDYHRHIMGAPWKSLQLKILPAG